VSHTEDVERLIANRLWKQFQFQLPDTPIRVTKTILKELADNGYTINRGETQCN